MDNFSPRWQHWLKNFSWFIATLVVLILFMTFFRNAVVLIALWLVGLGWGVVLAFQFSQLLFGGADITVSGAQLQEYLSQTRAYKKQIDKAIRNSSSKSERIHLDTLAQQIETWTASIEKLVQRLDSLGADTVIRRDLRLVPKAISDLKKRIEKETDEIILKQLEQALANRRKQLDALDQLQNSSKRAELQIENTLSMLGTIYSQILTGQSTSDVAQYSRMSEDVDEEVRRLEDHLAALQEVKVEY